MASVQIVFSEQTGLRPHRQYPFPLLEVGSLRDPATLLLVEILILPFPLEGIPTSTHQLTWGSAVSSGQGGECWVSDTVSALTGFSSLQRSTELSTSTPDNPDADNTQEGMNASAKTQTKVAQRLCTSESNPSVSPWQQKPSAVSNRAPYLLLPCGHKHSTIRQNQMSASAFVRLRQIWGQTRGYIIRSDERQRHRWPWT